MVTPSDYFLRGERAFQPRPTRPAPARVTKGGLRALLTALDTGSLPRVQELEDGPETEGPIVAIHEFNSSIIPIQVRRCKGGAGGGPGPRVSADRAPGRGLSGRCWRSLLK